MRVALLSSALILVAGSCLAQSYDAYGQAFAEHVVGATGSGGDIGLRMVVDLSHNRPQILKVGDAAPDGWVLKALTPQTATLAKGGETKRIGLIPGGTAPQGEAPYAAVVPTPNAEVQADIAAGDANAARADNGTPEQIWAAMRTAVLNSADTNALREFDNQEAQGPDSIVMGSFLPGGVGPNTPGAPPGFISTTGYYLGKDAEGHFVFYRTLGLLKAAGNLKPIE